MAGGAWRYHPDGQCLAAIDLEPDDADKVLERGWLTMNGRRAKVEERYPGANTNGMVTLRIRFDEPYPKWGGDNAPDRWGT